MSSEELMHHIHLKQGDVGRYVFLPGDPGRTERIAAHFDDPKEMAYNREYRTFTGTLMGEKVSVTSTGIGCPSAAIAVEELIAVGADTFIRVGTSGGMQPKVKPGDLAIVNGAIRDEGTSLHYLPMEFPAVADVDVVLAMREAAERLEQPYHIGVSQSKDSFYGQHAPERMPIAPELHDRWRAWVQGGAICSEMEAAIIFILASIYRKRAGGIMLMGINQESEEPVEPVRDQTELLKTAIEGVKILIEQDKAKEASA